MFIKPVLPPRTAAARALRQNRGLPDVPQGDITTPALRQLLQALTDKSGSSETNLTTALARIGELDLLIQSHADALRALEARMAAAEQAIIDLTPP